MNDDRVRDKATGAEKWDKPRKREREICVCFPTVFAVATGYLQIPELIYFIYINIWLMCAPFYIVVVFAVTVFVCSSRYISTISNGCLFTSSFTYIHSNAPSFSESKREENCFSNVLHARRSQLFSCMRTKGSCASETTEMESAKREWTRMRHK